jgi:hypothetical protein
MKTPEGYGGDGIVIYESLDKVRNVIDNFKRSGRKGSASKLLV